MNKAIELNPNDASTYYNRACSYAMLRNIKNAVEDLDKAISMKPALRNDAMTEKDFDPIRDHADFKKLIEQGG
ncbi:MAG: tetratricopeptide repeat protein [Desulfobacterales bacterium]|nr:tetratricopeptide repeat protein [Desulfobacterales bacterium]